MEDFEENWGVEIQGKQKASTGRACPERMEKRIEKTKWFVRAGFS